MNQAIRTVAAAVRIAPSACPHDCPSTCALDVEVFDGRTIGRVRGAEDNAIRPGVICAKVARYAERVASSGPPDPAAAPHGPPKAAANSRRSPGTTRSIIIAENFLRAEQRTRRRGGLALLSMPAPWAASCATASTGCAMPKNIPASSRTICVNLALDRLHRRHRQARRAGSARDGEVRSGGDLGHQRRSTPRSM